MRQLGGAPYLGIIAACIAFSLNFLYYFIYEAVPKLQFLGK
jgi:hypothetical protein